jgi:tetratricopeptide (TPR) repeat protein
MPLFKKQTKGDDLFHLATQHYEAQRWGETVAAVQDALAQGIKNYDLAFVYAVLGYSLTKLSREEEAVEAHKKSIEYNPNHVVAWRYYGITLRIMGKYDGAEECYEHALALQPDDELTLASLGALYIFRDKPQKAIDVIESAFQDGAQSGTTYSNLALALGMVGRFDDAEVTLSKAVAQGYQRWREVRDRIKNMREYHNGLNIHDTSWLPERCSQCGAALSDDTVHWVSGHTVQCGYCGSVNRK